MWGRTNIDETMNAVEMFCSFSSSSMTRVLFGSVVLVVSLLGTPQVACAGESGPPWSQLSKTEQSILQPLAPHWAQIDEPRKEKWRDVAARFPNMTAEQQWRARERMADWSSMSIDERSAARLRFQESKQLSPAEREARWKAYQALPEEQRRSLANKKSAASAAPALKPGSSAPTSTAALPRTKLGQPASGTLDSAQPKSNLTLPPPPTASANLRPVSPGSVQATSGLSTRPITVRPEPPKHQQVGQPKIAAGGASGANRANPAAPKASSISQRAASAPAPHTGTTAASATISSMGLGTTTVP